MTAFLSDPRRFALFLFGMSLLTLGIVYTAEYGFNMLPCPLCLHQRKPYFVVAFLAFGAFFAASRSPRLAWALIAACLLAFIANMGISGFHFGVEQGWWKGLEACGDASLPSGSSLDELQRYLSQRPIVDCRVAGGKFLGLSMTGYNFLLSAFLASVTALALARCKTAAAQAQ